MDNAKCPSLLKFKHTHTLYIYIYIYTHYIYAYIYIYPKEYYIGFQKTSF